MDAKTSTHAGGAPPPADMLLWYRRPGREWTDAMPIGNGIMGAMVFGGVGRERIALNESTFWSGRPHDYDNPEAFSYFPKIRDLVFAGRFEEAEKIATDHFQGVPVAQQAYQPLGDLLLAFDGDEGAAEYRRELDMATGVAKVRYRAGEVVFTREVFLSYPDRVMVVRIAGDKGGGVSVQAKFASPYLTAAAATGREIVADGCWKGPIPGDNWLIGRVEGEGLRFQARVVVRPEGGRVEAAGECLAVRGADAVTFVVTAATSFVNYHDISGDPAAPCRKILAGAAGKDYLTLRRRHEDDFRALMDRVHLNVGDAARNARPIDERLAAAREGAVDPNLEAIVFQFGRYLLASSSRAGGQPANLQGIWNEDVSPPWGSKYTININTEMNYWPAEVCNLSECHQPLFDMLAEVAVTGAKTAQTYYGCGGWVAHHNIDLWRGAAPVDAPRYGMWPVGGAWLCQHLWEHYAFTGDREFLAKHYPILKGSAQFLLELLVEHPRLGWLVTPFSMSPEHRFLDANGAKVPLSPAPTMDVAILRELFPHCIAAAELLGVDEEFRARIEAAIKRLPPYRINRLGHLQEWIEDWPASDDGHNVSPNFTLFPGQSITLRGDRPHAAAIERWMELSRPKDGWPVSWSIGVWARLERPDRVGEGIHTFIRESVAANLHNNHYNQTDANYGFTAVVAEALLQSHDGEIHLLPALPAGWPDGSVTGLRARGGFEVDIRWRGGALHWAEIRSAHAGPCKVRHGQKVAAFSLQAGRPLRLNAALASVAPGLGAQENP
ncbi:MAG: glycoside hydrolase family 95 protein [Planctomycetota bacterium]